MIKEEKGEMTIVRRNERCSVVKSVKYCLIR
jgi:glycerol-3-phosphate cytidylyltransferase-like family protein